MSDYALNAVLGVSIAVMVAVMLVSTVLHHIRQSRSDKRDYQLAVERNNKIVEALDLRSRFMAAIDRGKRARDEH